MKENEELNKLIEDNNKLNEEYKTKKIYDLKDIKVNNKKNNKRKIILIVLIILFLITLSLLIFFLISGTSDKKVEEEKIDYEYELNAYGDEITNIIKEEYDNNEVPTFNDIEDLITYNKYDIECDIHEIYDDLSIYLDSCKIDNKSINYKYGNKQDKVSDVSISVYKIHEGDKYYYSNESINNAEQVGSISCIDKDCKYISAYNDYVVIEENNKYNLYNYKTNKLEYESFSTDINNILSYDNKIFAIKNDNKIYNISTGKTLNNIEGTLVLPTPMLDTSIMYKYGYAIYSNNNKYNFINLKTGNISYTISDNILEFIENINNNTIYIVTYKNDTSKIKITSGTGKSLFSGKEYKFFKVINDEVIVSTNSKYQTYDSNLKLLYESKTYDSIEAIFDNYITVVDDNKLKLIDYSDNELATFDLEWDTNYSINTYLSGIKDKDNKKAIYIVVEIENNKQLEFYYIIDTKEIINY